MYIYVYTYIYIQMHIYRLYQLFECVALWSLACQNSGLDDPEDARPAQNIVKYRYSLAGPPPQLEVQLWPVQVLRVVRTACGGNKGTNYAFSD